MMRFQSKRGLILLGLIAALPIFSLPILFNSIAVMLVPLGSYLLVYAVKRKDPVGALFFIVYTSLFASLAFAVFLLPGVFFWRPWILPISLLAYSLVLILELRRFLTTECSISQGPRKLAMFLFVLALAASQALIIFSLPPG